MRKILLAVLAFCMLSIGAQAMADNGSALDLLKPMWLNALEDMRKQEAGQGAPAAEPSFDCTNDVLEVMRSGIYMNDQYGCEAYVYAQLRNNGEETLRIGSAVLNIYDAGGKRTAKEEYVHCVPEIVPPGESFYVVEWLYDFVNSLDRAAHMELTVEPREYGRRKIIAGCDAEAYIEDDYLCVKVTNTAQEPVYGVNALAVLSDADGKLLDVFSEGGYSAMAIDAQSAVIYRKRLEDHVRESMLENAVCDAAAYWYED